MAYLIDSDVFIRAKNGAYGLDFCPAFWDWLVAANAHERVFSVEAVYDELVGRDDELSEWAREHRGLFLAPTEETVRRLAEMIRWANESQDYDLVAKDEFADAADSSLVATAVVRSDTLVTHERASDSRKKIKIPNAAAAHNVKVLGPYAMLRAERARFVLEAAS